MQWSIVADVRWTIFYMHKTFYNTTLSRNIGQENINMNMEFIINEKYTFS